MILQFQYTDGGRFFSHRPRQTNDCAVVAFAVALRIPYDQAYDMLANAGRECGRGTYQGHWRPLLERFAVKEKNEFVHYPFIRFMDKPEHGRGTWLVQIQRHIFAIVDGVIHDAMLRPASEPVIAAWRVERFPTPIVVPEFE